MTASSTYSNRPINYRDLSVFFYVTGDILTGPAENNKGIHGAIFHLFVIIYI